MFDSWSIRDGAVVLMNSFTTTAGELIVGEYILTPYQYDKSRYLPIHQDGDYFMVLTVKAE